MGKIFDDFHAISYRGFDFLESRPGWLEKVRDDLFYLMTKKVLESFQIQFHGYSGKKWAVEFTIKADGSIQQDDDSGAIDYWQIPENVTMKFPTRWKKGSKEIDDEMIKRGWTGKASYLEDDLIDDVAYSKNGYGASRGRRGAWNH